MFKVIGVIDKALTTFENAVLALSLSLMLFINVGNVLSRFWLHQSWATTEELSRYLFVAATLVGSSAAAKYGDHLSLTLVANYLGNRGGKWVKRFLLLIRGLGMAGLFMILANLGFKLVEQRLQYGQISPALGIPRWIPTTAIPVGGLLIFLRSLQYTITEWGKTGD